MAKQRRKRRSGLSAALETLKEKYERQKMKVIERGIRPMLKRAKQLEADLANVKEEITAYMSDGAPKVAATTRALAAPAKTKGKRRARMTADDKMKIAAKVYSMFSAPANKGKKKFGQKDVNDLFSPLLLRELVPLWNKANPDKKISKSGKKATTVYFVG